MPRPTRPGGAYFGPWGHLGVRSAQRTLRDRHRVATGNAANAPSGAGVQGFSLGAAHPRLKPWTPDGGRRLRRHAGLVLGAPRGSELADLDVERLDPIGNLPRCHVEQARGLGLDPAGLFQGGDDALAFVEIRVVQVDLGA